jgi:IS1 family transposase
MPSGQLHSTTVRRIGKTRPVANVLKREKQLAILKLLVEGNSIRSTERITGVSRNAIMRLLVRFGTACREFLDLNLSNLYLEHVEIDEIWTFVRKKQRKLHGFEIIDPEIGDIYLFTVIDQRTKLLASFAIGKRNHQTTQALVRDLESRMIRRPDETGAERPQLSTDGWASYPGAIAERFGSSVKHGVLIKQYRNPEVGRYAPPDLMGTERIAVQNVSDLSTICTSHVERHNLTLRTFMKRFTRLSMGFSKKLTNLAAAAALQVAYYNFCWRLRQPGASGKLTPTPAMMAGLVDTLWTIEDLYDAVMDQQARKKHTARVQKLIATR